MIILIFLVPAFSSLLPKETFGARSNTITSPDTGRNVGQHTSLVLNSKGKLGISYYDVNGALKVMHCANVNCTSDNLQVPDKAGDVGQPVHPAGPGRPRQTGDQLLRRHQR